MLDGFFYRIIFALRKIAYFGKLVINQKNMKKLPFLAIVLIVLSCQLASAQKLTIKKNTAYIDGKEYLKISDCGQFAEECSISNLAGKELISINQLPEPDKPGTYFEVLFNGLNTAIEMRTNMRYLVKLLYKKNIVAADGSLIPENVKKLKEEYKYMVIAPAESDD